MCSSDLELRLFFTALQFFTRVPVPAWVGWSPAQLNASARHFTTVGLFVGAVTGGVLLGAMACWPVPVAVLLSMTAGVLLTGGFHEDGLADSCDGFGGGYTPERVLAIMKDSRVGSYATIGIALALALKFQLLLSLATTLAPATLLAAVVAMARLNAGTNSMGTGMELTVIAAAVIGGVSLAGGAGSVGGTVLGALIIQSIDSGLLLTDVSIGWRMVVLGQVLVAAVVFDRVVQK